MMRRPPRSTPFPSTTLFRSPKNAHTHNNLAHALRATGQLDAAAVEFKEAIRLKPDYAGAHNDLAWLLATCDDLKLREDRKRTRLNSSHSQISYADFCLKQKNECLTYGHSTECIVVVYLEFRAVCVYIAECGLCITACVPIIRRDDLAGRNRPGDLDPIS